MYAANIQSAQGLSFTVQLGKKTCLYRKLYLHIDIMCTLGGVGLIACMVKLLCKYYIYAGPCRSLFDLVQTHVTSIGVTHRTRYICQSLCRVYASEMVFEVRPLSTPSLGAVSFQGQPYRVTLNGLAPILTSKGQRCLLKISPASLPIEQFRSYSISRVDQQSMQKKALIVFYVHLHI